MKKSSVWRKVLAVSLAAAVLAGTGFTAVGSYVGTSVSVSAAQVYGDFEYEVNKDNTVTVTKYTGKGGAVVIPGKIDSKSVMSIGASAFWGCTGLTSITISNSVTSIGDCAFWECTGLTSITIPDSVTSIGYNAFQNCTGLKRINISHGMTSINGFAFSGCTGLTSITIPDSVTSIGDGAFSDCTGLKSITIPDSVTSVGYRAFDNTAWYNNQPDGIVCAGKILYKYKGTMPENTIIVVPDSVTSIGIEAFLDCTGLKSITISDNVTSIDCNAFYGCTGLTSITVGKNNTVYSSDNGILLNKNKTKLIFCPQGKKGQYVIPDSVTSISDFAFMDCKGLTSITISDSVTSIGGSAFSGCKGLTSIIIPDSVTSIGDFAFMDCKGLTSIAIPKNVTSIGYASFSRCTGLTSITIPDSVTSIGYNAFQNCTGLTSITIPDSVTSIGYNAFQDCTGLKSITIPDSVTEIGRKAFDHCSGLKIYGAKGSRAETYANENKIPFTAVLMNTSTLSADKIIIGQTVTVKAKASEDNCTYAVYYKKKATSNWTVKQNYSTNDTVTIKPAKATDYDVCVKVKDSKGKIVKKYFEVKVNDKLKNTSTISAETIKKGQSVTVKGVATGGMGGYTYAVYYKKKAETKWTTRQGYKDNSEILVRPYTNTDYDICIKVKDKDGTIAKKYFTVTVTK